MNTRIQDTNTHDSQLWGLLRIPGLLALSAMALAGLWALSDRFRSGLMVTHLTQLVPWGLWIAFYIYFIGLSAGSFLLSTLIYVGGMKRLEAAGPLALLQALGCLLLGMFLIWVDLGHPERFLNVFLFWHWTSILAWESIFYGAYTLIILAELFLVLRPALASRAQAGGPWAGFYEFIARGRRVPDAEWRAKASRRLMILGLVGIPVAIGVHGGTGAIFAVVKSRPTWYTGLFPILFLVSALASGGGLLTFLSATALNLPREKKLELVRSLARLTVGILAFDFLLMASEILVVFYGGIPHHVIGWWNILFGPFWWVFWFVQLGMGVILPILIVAGRRTGRSLEWLALAGLLVAVGIIGVRLNIVIPAQIEPEFAGLPQAYHHVRFAYGYFPSLNEWLVGLGTIALGILAFMFVRKVLPLDEAEHPAPQKFEAEGGRS